MTKEIPPPARKETRRIGAISTLLVIVILWAGFGVFTSGGFVWGLFWAWFYKEIVVDTFDTPHD